MTNFYIQKTIFRKLKTIVIQMHEIDIFLNKIVTSTSLTSRDYFFHYYSA